MFKSLWRSGVRVSQHLAPRALLVGSSVAVGATFGRTALAEESGFTRIEKQIEANLDVLREKLEIGDDVDDAGVKANILSKLAKFAEALLAASDGVTIRDQLGLSANAGDDAVKLEVLNLLIFGDRVDIRAPLTPEALAVDPVTDIEYLPDEYKLGTSDLRNVMDQIVHKRRAIRLSEDLSKLAGDLSDSAKLMAIDGIRLFGDLIQLFSSPDDAVASDALALLPPSDKWLQATDDEVLDIHNGVLSDKQLGELYERSPLQSVPASINDYPKSQVERTLKQVTEDDTWKKKISAFTVRYSQLSEDDQAALAENDDAIQQVLKNDVAAAVLSPTERGPIIAPEATAFKHYCSSLVQNTLSPVPVATWESVDATANAILSGQFITEAEDGGASSAERQKLAQVISDAGPSKEHTNFAKSHSRAEFASTFKRPVVVAGERDALRREIRANEVRDLIELARLESTSPITGQDEKYIRAKVAREHNEDVILRNSYDPPTKDKITEQLCGEHRWALRAYMARAQKTFLSGPGSHAQWTLIAPRVYADADGLIDLSKCLWRQPTQIQIEELDTRVAQASQLRQAFQTLNAKS